jgi:hypothetical protein
VFDLQRKIVNKFYHLKLPTFFRARPLYSYFTTTHPSYQRRLPPAGIVGWRFQTLSAPGNKYVYNTELPGYGKYGHYFGDHLTEAERKAVIEYLKTL